MARQTFLNQFDQADDELTDAERAAWEAIEEGDMGPREFQRQQGYSSPGTVSNLLARARKKRGGDR